MNRYIDYFDRTGYKPKYFIGDKVSVVWNKKTYTGTVANDTLISEEIGPQVFVFPDEPFEYKGEIKSLIICTHKDVKSISETSSDIKKPKKKE